MDNHPTRHFQHAPSRWLKKLYRERDPTGRFICTLKHFRHLANRCDKLAANVLAMVQLASKRPWLLADGPRPHR